MKKLVLIGGILIALVLPGAAIARGADDSDEEEGSPWASPGVYVFLGGVITKDEEAKGDFQNTARNSGTFSPLVRIDHNQHAGGLKAKVGYRVIPWFAVEAEYEYLTNLRMDMDDIDKLVEFQYHTLTGNVKGYFPLGRFQPFALAGVGMMSVDQDAKDPRVFDEQDLDLVVRMGGGIDLYVTDHLAVALDCSYLLPTGDVRNRDYISFGMGLQYMF